MTNIYNPWLIIDLILIILCLYAIINFVYISLSSYIKGVYATSQANHEIGFMSQLGNESLLLHRFKDVEKLCCFDLGFLSILKDNSFEMLRGKNVATRLNTSAPTIDDVSSAISGNGIDNGERFCKN